MPPEKSTSPDEQMSRQNRALPVESCRGAIASGGCSPVCDPSRETKSQPRGSRISKQRFGSAPSRRHEKDRSRQRVKHHSVRGAEERTLQQIVVRLKTTRLQSPILRLLEDWRLLTEKGSAGPITA